MESPDACLEQRFRQFAQALVAFPTGATFSAATHQILDRCRRELSLLSADDKLLEYYATEYRLFQYVERRLCQAEISRLFKDIDDFLQTASSIMNRRKSRAGRSLENHVDFLLNEAKIPHEMQPKIDGKPDIVIPHQQAYLDSSYPDDKLFIVGVKTTCKDRWRQVLNEGRRLRRKHLLTLQPGISSNQLTEMYQAGITLIVPRKLQEDYPKGHPISILTLEDFVLSVDKATS